MKKYHPTAADNSYREFTLLQRNTDNVIEGLPPIHLTYNHLKTFRINAASNQRCFVEVQTWLNAAYKSIDPDSDAYVIVELHHCLDLCFCMQRLARRHLRVIMFLSMN